MSDWKSRAKPVGEWKARAAPAPAEPDAVESDEPPGAIDPTTKLGAAAQGISHGVTLGFGDEVSAALDTIPEATHRAAQAIGLASDSNADIEGHYDQDSANDARSKQRGSLMDHYRAVRDSYRADNDAASEAHPVIHGVSDFAGGMLVPLPGGTAKSVAGKIAKGAAKGAGYGAAAGAGDSQADLTKGDVSGLAGDVAKSTAFGAAGGAVGGVVEAAASKLGARFGAKAAAAEAAERAAKKTEAVESAVGTLGHDTQDTNRALENLDRVLANPATSPALRAKLQAFMKTPDYAALVEQAGENTLNAMPSKLARNAASRQAIADAPALASKASDEFFGKNTITADVLPRLAHYAKPAAGAVVGGLVGGGIGAGGGSLVGASIGKPGKAVANMVKNPRFRVQSLEALESLLGLSGESAAKGSIVAGERMAEGDDEEDNLKKRFSTRVNK